MILTGRPKAFAKSNWTHPCPRLSASETGRLSRTRPGIADRDRVVPPVLGQLRTADSICRGVSVGPDGNFRGSVSPLTRALTLFPPMSMTSTFIQPRTSPRGRLLPVLGPVS